MYSTNWVILAIKIFSFAISMNQVSSADVSALLSRLYQRASAADRPLIVLIDSKILPSEPQPYKKPNTLLDVIGYNRLESRTPLSLVQKNKKLPTLLSHKRHKSYNIEKKLHHTLLPKRSREREVLRSPIIRNLLRISKTLKCHARDQCEDECNTNYSGHKNDQCVDTCEVKYECEEDKEEKEESACEEDSCGEDNATGSTKGYASTEPSVGCNQC